MTAVSPSTPDASLPSNKLRFYRACLEALNGAPLPYVVGGAYAVRHFTGIARRTKDLDVFVRPSDCEAALAALARAGYRTEVVNSGWLAKAHCGAAFVDVIFRSGNGLAEVDDAWFTRAERMELFGVAAPVSPPEEVIWSKAFTMERERFDLADVAHMVRAKGAELDWPHLIARFGPYWRVLLAHLVLYGFIYPGQRDQVPESVMAELTSKLQAEGNKPEGPSNVCMGTLLSGSQYLVDVLWHGYEDARFTEVRNMSTEELAAWHESLAAETPQRLIEHGFIRAARGQGPLAAGGTT